MRFAHTPKGSWQHQQRLEPVQTLENRCTSDILRGVCADRNEGIVKKITVVILLLASVFAWAGAEPNPAEYTVNIHISSSSIADGGRQQLSVVIEGKNYTLESEISPYLLLALGDYKAKLVKDEHKTTYDSAQIYEFLFPDKKTRRFTVIGQSE
jgi:hypothetical protein